jgi:hypothetical protein
MTPQIGIVPLFDDDPMHFEVTIRDASGMTRHRVAVSRQELARLGAGADAETVIAAAFRFLLDREPKEAILARFDIRDIARYFPEFETTLGAYLVARG